MNEKIEIGDLVMVIKWPCCGAAIGKIWRVEHFRIYRSMCCGHCCADIGAGQVALSNYWHASKLEWLKKLNPPPIEKATLTRDQITA